MFPALFALALLGGTPEPWLGPLEVGSQAPSSIVRFAPSPRSAETLPRGRSRVSISGTWTNTWADTQWYHLDYEMLATEVRAAYGVEDGLEVEAAVVQRTLGGGIMDRPIDEFHRALNLPDAGRPNAPRNQLGVWILPTRTQPGFTLSAADTDSSLARASVVKRLRDVADGGPAIAVSLDAQGETGSLPTPDLALGLTLSQPFAGAVMHGGGFVTRVASTHSGTGLRLRPQTAAGWLSLELPITPNQEAFGQYLVSGGALPDYRVFSSASHELSVGWKARLPAGYVVSAAFLENLFVMDNSPDWGWFGAISRSF